MDDALGESELSIVFGKPTATGLLLRRVVLFVADTSHDVGLRGVVLLDYEVAFRCAVGVQSDVTQGSFQHFLRMWLQLAIFFARQ